MGNRHGVIPLLATVSLVTVAAVAGPASAKTVTLVNYYRGWGALIDIYKVVQDEFVKTHPEIRVRFENAAKPEDYFTRLELMLSAGTAPDLVLMESTEWARYAQHGLMTDLTPYLAKEKDLKLGDFHKAALDLWSYKGQTYGLPCDVAVMQLAYNQDLLDRQGIPYPQASWGKDEFVNTLRKLTIDRNGDGQPEVYGISPGWNYYLWEQVLYSFGGNIADRREHPTKCTLDSPEAAAALQFMADLRNKVRVVGGDFVSGKTAFEAIGHWNIPDFRKAVKFRWDVAEVPTLQKRAVIGYGSAYMIPAGSKHKQEAWELLKYYAGAEGSRMLAKANFMTPAYRPVSESSVFLDNAPPANKRAFLNAFAYITPRVVTTQWDKAISTVFLPEYEKVLYGKKSPQEAMAKVAPQITKLFERDR